jgi:ATP-dependent Clp protease adaptor protein ClpS
MERLNYPRMTSEAPLREHDAQTRPDRGWLVTVYDNDHNTLEEVTMVLMLATECDVNEAEMETWEVHNLGRSVVHIACEEECRVVAEIISDSGIRVEVSPND